MADQAPLARLCLPGGARVVKRVIRNRIVDRLAPVAKQRIGWVGGPRHAEGIAVLAARHACGWIEIADAGEDEYGPRVVDGGAAGVEAVHVVPAVPVPQPHGHAGPVYHIAGDSVAPHWSLAPCGHVIRHGCPQVILIEDVVHLVDLIVEGT
eukprot:7072620-Prymnesium_polylepis.1